MSLDVYIYGLGRERRRQAPLAVSLLLHGGAFFALMNAPEIRLPEQSKSAYKQAIEGKEAKLVWYKFNKELPDVRPPEARPDRRPLRAAVQAPQQIVASRKDAAKRTQMVWTPAPELRETPPVELPNVLAIRLPEIARPFVPPPEIQRPKTAKIEVPADAPELRTRPLDPVKLADAPRISKPFVPPPTKVPVKVTAVALPSAAPEAPRLEARVDAPALNYSFKTPARPFTAPPAKTGPTTDRQITTDAPPPLSPNSASAAPNTILNANSRDLNLAVVGLNPSNKPAALPVNSSPGQFAAGPIVRPDGADSAGDGKGLSVPDLFVAGAKNARPDLIAQAFAAPTSTSNLRAAARLAEPHAPGPPDDSQETSSGAVKVSSAPDRRFTGRDVYMMAIQMPNLTSYSGSWLMWYADRTAREAGLAPVAPPIPHRKVDPKYVAAAAADKIEGKVQLACVIGTDGRVSTVELVRGLDDRLNQSAEQALAKWEFTPATRHGEPVEVDVLVEIPFRLAPHAQVPF
jgi:TonB family protein